MIARRTWRLAAGLALVPLAGCATLGEPEFGCRGYPGEPLCLSASEVYAATESTDRVIPPGGREAGDAEDETRGSGMPLAADPDTIADEPTHPSLSPSFPEPLRLPVDPGALRTPAGVLRIWVAPWEDTAGNLHAPGYVFTEVEPRRWRVGVAGLVTPAVLRPLQVEPRETPGSGTNPPGRPEADGRVVEPDSSRNRRPSDSFRVPTPMGHPPGR